MSSGLLILKRLKPLIKQVTRMLQACWIWHWYYEWLLLSKYLFGDSLFGFYMPPLFKLFLLKYLIDVD